MYKYTINKGIWSPTLYRKFFLIWGVRGIQPGHMWIRDTCVFSQIVFEWNVQTLAIQRVLPNCASLFATFLLSHPSDWSLSHSTCWSSRQLATPVSESTVDVHKRISVYICINKNYIHIYVAAVEQHDLNTSEHVSNVRLPTMLTYEFSERKGLPLARVETALTSSVSRYWGPQCYQYQSLSWQKLRNRHTVTSVCSLKSYTVQKKIHHKSLQSIHYKDTWYCPSFHFFEGCRHLPYASQ